MLDPDDPVTLKSLSDLHRVQPSDETLRNLLGTLTAKLDLCARLPFLAYEAEREGFQQAAATFRGLADTERRVVTDLLSSLRCHLDHTAATADVSSERTP